MPKRSNFQNTQADTSASKNAASARLTQSTVSYAADFNDHHYSNVPLDSTKNIIFTKFFNSTEENFSAYENLCSGCGYGVFEARGKLCNFCQYVVNGYLEDNSNIYENICDKCSELYSGGECLVCFRNSNVNKRDNVPAKAPTKKLKKRLLNSLIGSLKRVKSFNVTNGNNRKLHIVHNVDGYENVFRTNETFDLNRICELKHLKSSRSDHHIYGKLRISDDHLLRTAPFETVKQKSQSDDYLIAGTSCRVISRSPSTNSQFDPTDDNKSLPPTSARDLREAGQIHKCICEWLTSLRGETHDYCSFGNLDTVICNPKGIPAIFSKTSYCPPSLKAYPDTKTDVWTLMATDASAFNLIRLRSDLNKNDNDNLDDTTFEFTQQLVNEFKRHLMEKQKAPNRTELPRSRRQGIYLKVDSIESKQQTSHYPVDLVGDDHSKRNCLWQFSAQSQFVPKDLTTGSENNCCVARHQSNKRFGIHEKESEFVSDILQVFDSFLLKESSCGKSGDHLADDDHGSGDLVSKCKVQRVQSNVLFTYSSHQKEPSIDIGQVIINSELSKTLNKILITYDPALSLFLKCIHQSQRYSHVCLSRVVRKFHRFQVFLGHDRTVNIVARNELQQARSLASAISDIPVIESSRTSDILPTLESLPEPQHSCIMTVPRRSSICETKKDTTVQDNEDDEEHIYQPIWKFKTVGEAPENCPSDGFYDHLVRMYDSSLSITGEDVEDHDEWEPDDEFTFTTNKLVVGNKEPDAVSMVTTQSSSGSTITRYDSSISTLTIASSLSLTHHLFRNICIFYSLKEPKMRAVLYDYDRTRCSTYFTLETTDHRNERQSGWGAMKRNVLSQSPPNGNNNSPKYIPRDPSESASGGCGNAMMSDSVQAWKYMLLDVNYLEDEEDMIVSESQILKAQAIKEIDSTPPPVGMLQRFKSISSGNLLDVPAEEDKKSITERVRNKLQRGVFKLQTRSPKETKKSRNIFRRNEATSLYLEDGMKPKYPIFKTPLEQLEMNDTSYPDVPRFVVDCIEYIEQKDCIQIDGLYRASGNKVAVDELKQKLTESYIYDPKLLITDDIHTLTSLLKQFFRELGAPLIPQEIYQKLVATRNLMDSSAIENMKVTFNEMKNPNRATLKYLIKHLTTVAHYSNENRMPASNLAIVWGPCILSANQIEYDIARMNTLAKVLIENYDKIFGDNERLVS